MIIARLSGGMGNQMFQYAVGRALSIKHNVPLKLNIEGYSFQNPRLFKGYAVRKFDLDLFTIQAEIAQRKEIPWMFRMYGRGQFALIFDAIRRRLLRHKGYEAQFSPFNPSILALGPNAYLDGVWQSPKYFNHIRDIIKSDFTLKENPAENIQMLFNKIKKENAVCIHVRRGDFLNYTHFFGEVGQDYYFAAVHRINQSASIDKLYVFSDDIEWCKENLKFEFPVMFVGPEYSGKKDEGHLFLMSACAHFIVATSSFSWWAAWLSDRSDKIVVAPKQWFKNTSLNTEDLLPPEWIRM